MCAPAGRQALHVDRLLGTAGGGRGLDASGQLGVTYEELSHFLRTEDQVRRPKAHQTPRSVTAALPARA
jgi:hypothetical protein